MWGGTLVGTNPLVTSQLISCQCTTCLLLCLAKDLINLFIGIQLLFVYQDQTLTQKTCFNVLQ